MGEWLRTICMHTKMGVGNIAREFRKDKTWGESKTREQTTACRQQTENKAKSSARSISWTRRKLSCVCRADTAMRMTASCINGLTKGTRRAIDSKVNNQSQHTAYICAQGRQLALCVADTSTHVCPSAGMAIEMNGGVTHY